MPEILERYKSIDAKQLHREGRLADFGLPFEYATYGKTRSRPFFVCACGRRTQKLYLKDGDFACRTCHGLIYESNLLSPKRRKIARAVRQRQKIGASANLLEPRPSKPPTMPWRKFAELSGGEIDTKRTCEKILMRSADNG